MHWHEVVVVVGGWVCVCVGGCSEVEVVEGSGYWEGRGGEGSWSSLWPWRCRLDFMSDYQSKYGERIANFPTLYPRLSPLSSRSGPYCAGHTFLLRARNSLADQNLAMLTEMSLHWRLNLTLLARVLIKLA